MRRRAARARTAQVEGKYSTDEYTSRGDGRCWSWWLVVGGWVGGGRHTLAPPGRACVAGHGPGPTRPARAGTRHEAQGARHRAHEVAGGGSPMQGRGLLEARCWQHVCRRAQPDAQTRPRHVYAHGQLGTRLAMGRVASRRCVVIAGSHSVVWTRAPPSAPAARGSDPSPSAPCRVMCPS